MKKSQLIALCITVAVVLAVVAAWLWQKGSPSTSSLTTAAAPEAPVVLTPAVSALLTAEPASLQQRLNFLPTLGNKLPAADRKALLDSIINTPPNGLTKDDWYALANDILQALRNQRPATPEYTDHLIALWHDQNLDPTLRDYALQQLREWVADGDSRTVHEERPDKIALIRKTFLDAATPGHPTCDPQSTTTGTALLALDEWTPPTNGNRDNGNKESAADSLAPLFLDHSSAATSHRGVRATALQLCARRNIMEALPIARSILADGSSDVILRMSAISLLGTLGNTKDITLLTHFQQENSRDPLLQSSLVKALQSLNSQ